MISPHPWLFLALAKLHRLSPECPCPRELCHPLPSPGLHFPGLEGAGPGLLPLSGHSRKSHRDTGDKEETATQTVWLLPGAEGTSCRLFLPAPPSPNSPRGILENAPFGQNFQNEMGGGVDLPCLPRLSELFSSACLALFVTCADTVCRHMCRAQDQESRGLHLALWPWAGL